MNGRKKMQKKMQKAIKTVGSLEFLDKMSPPGSPKFSHSRPSLDSLRSADQQMDLAGHEKNKLRGEIDGLMVLEQVRIVPQIQNTMLFANFFQSGTPKL